MPAGDSLRDQVRRRLSPRSCSSPAASGRPSAGAGTRGLRVIISTTEVQYTVRVPTTNVVVHLGCYLVWRQESEAARLRGET
jgi:hypothetical protein